ncbi:MAG: hypothetical protein AAB337_02870 [Patescibacteria group bacterium]
MFDKNEMEQMRGLMHEVVGETLEEIVLPQFQDVREEIAGIKVDIVQIRADIVQIRADIVEIRVVMVTKDFLEDRLADFRVSLTHSADWIGLQLKRLTNIMYQRQLLTAQHVLEIHGK